MTKHYGIPYMGSKEKILHLIAYICEREVDKKYFIDPFCGGFSVSAYVLENTKFKVLANDLNKYVIALYKEILFNNSREFNKVALEWVIREKFADVKNNPQKYPDWYVGYVLTIWSFGNKQSTYMFGKDIEADKKKLHDALVFDTWSDDFMWLKDIMPKLPTEYSPQKRLTFMGVYKRAIKGRAELQQLEQLQRLQQLQQLERLERLEQLERLQQLDWHDFINSIPEDVLKKAFIYCDPPYENTATYSHNEMDYDKFWDWFRTFPYPVYVSSYSAPDDIKPINFTKKVVTLSVQKGRKRATENIYYNGNGTYAPTMYDMLFNAQIPR